MNTKMRAIGGVAIVFAVCLAAIAAEWHASFRVHAGNLDDAIPAPEMIGEGIISTDGDELGGGVTADGKTLIFEKSASPHYLYIMCESHFVNGKWGRPEILPFSGQYRDTDPVLAPDGESSLFASDRPVGDYAAELERPVEGLKIGVPEEYFGEGLDPEIRAAIDREG